MDFFKNKKKKHILVVGGAGYVGSFINVELERKGYNPVIIDNLSTGHRKAVRCGTFYECDLNDLKTLRSIFSKHNFGTVMHFGGDSSVGESVVNPHKYFYNNVGNTLNLLTVMNEFDIKNLIYSSTPSIYGHPEYLPIDEKHPLRPFTPYGMSVMYTEQIIKTYEKAYGLKHVFLRYFNAAGADFEGMLGEDHYPETHIIPLLLKTALGQKKLFTLFGNNYDTKDGTCIRDYIHIQDLATAHIKALEYLNSEKKSNEFNLGNAIGFSVKEIIHKATEVSGREIQVETAERRPGDPAVLIASAEKAKEILHWEPQYDLDQIIQSAWIWFKKYPNGYKNVK